MAHLNADVVEEDAADLQFPKDWIFNNVLCTELVKPVERKEILTSDFICLACKSLIFEPYIQCAVCDGVILCLLCFADGWEKSNHKNTHSYIIIRNNFPLIKDSDWTAREEKKLIELIEECGIGNWEDISSKLLGRSLEDCKQHYFKYYIDNQSLVGLPRLETKFYNSASDSIQYKFKLDMEEPPRFLSSSHNYKLVAGYNSARSDFEFNFDNDAEFPISNLNFNQFFSQNQDNLLNQQIHFSIFNAYNERIKERLRRKKIIRNHGLISLRKSVVHLQRYDTSVKKLLIDRFRIFFQLLNGIEMDSILECLHKIGDLKNYLKKLIHYRKNGIQHFHNILMFEELLKLQQQFQKDRKQIISNIECNLKTIASVTNDVLIVNTNLSQRKIAPPLEIHPGMIDYEKLSSTEKILCSTTRILPDSYIYFKQILINESKKSGNVKLAQARQLLKIDVNKTKKIYEFLVQQGHICN